MSNSIPKYILPLIVLAQFFCTSVWFAGNAIATDLIQSFSLPKQSIGYLVSSVQFGFIIGTFVFAFFKIADRFAPSKVFFASALVSALSNLLITFSSGSLIGILSLRFISGFCLAGVYPVGMKIAADYFEKGLGKSLGYLVGALVLGTALPHLIKEIGQSFEWSSVLYSTSALSFTGGLALLIWVPDGPNRHPFQGKSSGKLSGIFKNKEFVSAANGYFGHMWELYTFWAFVPIMLKLYAASHPKLELSISLLSFFIIGIGSLACVVSTQIAHQKGAKNIAYLMLGLSGLCCLLSPLMLMMPFWLFITFLLFWGFTVIADSPLFSTLVAQTANKESKGTALTIVNGIGFGITIISIETMNFIALQSYGSLIFLVLAVGPAYGLFRLLKPTS